MDCLSGGKVIALGSSFSKDLARRADDVDTDLASLDDELPPGEEAEDTEPFVGFTEADLGGEGCRGPGFKMGGPCNGIGSERDLCCLVLLMCLDLVASLPTLFPEDFVKKLNREEFVTVLWEGECAWVGEGPGEAGE